MTSARILVVDDEKGVVHSCTRVLQRHGYTVTGITDSQAASRLLKEESFDLLLTDIKMPRMDGLELLRVAKEIDPHLTVVLITGYGTMEDAINAIRLGAQGFIMKPFEPEDLIATIEHNLARRALIRDSLRLQTLLPLLEINHILQVSGGEASLIRRVLDIARHEIGAARLAWLSCHSPLSSPFPFDKKVILKSHLSHGEQVVEMAVAPDATIPSTLPSEAVEAALAQAHAMWVLADGKIVTKLEGQARVIGVLLPLVINGEVIGLLTAETGQTGRVGSFNQISLDLLSVLAGQLAMMLENVQLFQQTEALRTFNEDIIQNMTNGLIAVDREGFITAFNPAASRMLGYEVDEVLYRPLQKIIHSDDLVKIVAEIFTTGQAYAHQEITIRHLDGNLLSVSVSAAPLGPSDTVAESVGVVAVLEDLSEVKALEAERRRLDRLAALGEMSAVVAHEIRNPVAGIAAGVDYLTRNVSKASPEFEGVMMIRGEIQRVNRILEDILFVARPARLKLSSEDLAQIIENVIQRCQAQIKESHVTVSTECIENLPPLHVDRQRLEQVFTNLVINATQAMSNGGQLLLQINLTRAQKSNRASEVIVTIADTGPGIPVEARGRIFEPFFTTKVRGTGLGLTVAHRIIEEHGGSISVESEVAKGTRFIISLPIPERAVV